MSLQGLRLVTLVLSIYPPYYYYPQINLWTWNAWLILILGLHDTGWSRRFRKPQPSNWHSMDDGITARLVFQGYKLGNCGNVNSKHLYCFGTYISDSDFGQMCSFQLKTEHCLYTKTKESCTQWSCRKSSLHVFLDMLGISISMT